ncbi:hypothetical protein ADUPG1_007122 [Aduncisulcus paluster]|uniref:Uncharacterized protein n=1 Tax=Aduncisulcus paluster TaxID=2918883 RepID=A0ABQ5KKT5_9EUKA|nr:hypothetical protein ADUPG1_007122 [Aduncisulcus paluster]
MWWPIYFFRACGNVFVGPSLSSSDQIPNLALLTDVHGSICSQCFGSGEGGFGSDHEEYLPDLAHRDRPPSLPAPVLSYSLRPDYAKP